MLFKQVALILFSLSTINNCVAVGVDVTSAEDAVVLSMKQKDDVLACLRDFEKALKCSWDAHCAAGRNLQAAKEAFGNAGKACRHERLRRRFAKRSDSPRASMALLEDAENNAQQRDTAFLLAYGYKLMETQNSLTAARAQVDAAIAIYFAVNGVLGESSFELEFRAKNNVKAAKRAVKELDTQLEELNAIEEGESEEAKIPQELEDIAREAHGCAMFYLERAIELGLAFFHATDCLMGNLAVSQHLVLVQQLLGSKNNIAAAKHLHLAMLVWLDPDAYQEAIRVRAEDKVAAKSFRTIQRRRGGRGPKHPGRRGCKGGFFRADL